MLGVEGSIAEEGGVLGHTVCKGHIVVLAPATERVQKQDWVPVSLLDELFTGVFKEEHVAIVKWVPDLESVDNIGILLGDGSLDLLGRQSVLVITVVEHGSVDEAHGVATDEQVSLGEDGLGAGVVL